MFLFLSKFLWKVVYHWYMYKSLSGVFLAKQKWHLSIGSFKLIRVTWLDSNSPRLKYVCYPKKQNLKKQKQNQHFKQMALCFPTCDWRDTKIFFFYFILMLHLSPKPTVININTWYAFFSNESGLFVYILMFYFYARCIQNIVNGCILTGRFDIKITIYVGKMYCASCIFNPYVWK